MENMMTALDIAEKCNCDVRNIYRWVRSNNIQFKMIPHPKKFGSETMGFDEPTSQYIINLRSSISKSESLSADDDVENDSGNFYIIQIIPDIYPNRLKLGYATSISSRLSQHKTTSPTAKVLKTYSCKSSWESAVIQAVGKKGKFIGGEVYDFDDISECIKIADKMFEMLV